MKKEPCDKCGSFCFSKKLYLCSRFGLSERKYGQKFYQIMEALLPFSIPVSGLKEGVHQYVFQVDRAFFRAFEGALLDRAAVEVALELDKRPSLLLLTFRLKGWVEVECDRCLGAFQLPIEREHELMVKYAEEASDQAEVMYIRRDAFELNVAKPVYDFIHLSVPMHKTHDLIGEACRPEMLRFLQEEQKSEGKGEEEREIPAKDVWDTLRDIFK